MVAMKATIFVGVFYPDAFSGFGDFASDTRTNLEADGLDAVANGDPTDQFFVHLINEVQGSAVGL